MKPGLSFSRLNYAVIATLCGALLIAGQVQAQTDPLSSWNDGPAKQAIIQFVQTVTEKSSPNYVAPEDRIATFDQDGTLWVEHPLYVQGIFALERLTAMAPQHPEWQTPDPFKSVLAGDRAAMAKFNEQDWAQIVMATHAGMTTEAFLEIVKQWLATAKHPRFRKSYTELVYQPMLEVMNYLRSQWF